MLLHLRLKFDPSAFLRVVELDSRKVREVKQIKSSLTSLSKAIQTRGVRSEVKDRREGKESERSTRMRFGDVGSCPMMKRAF